MSKAMTYLGFVEHEWTGELGHTYSVRNDSGINGYAYTYSAATKAEAKKYAKRHARQFTQRLLKKDQKTRLLTRRYDEAYWKADAEYEREAVPFYHANDIYPSDSF